MNPDKYYHYGYGGPLNPDIEAMQMKEAMALEGQMAQPDPYHEAFEPAYGGLMADHPAAMGESESAELIGGRMFRPLPKSVEFQSSTKSAASPKSL